MAAAGGGAVLIVGDFNLAPPLDTGSPCAAAGAFDGLAAAGYIPLLANESGNLATNADRLVTANTGGRCYDNAWFRHVPSAVEDAAGAELSAAAEILLERAFRCLADGLEAGRQVCWLCAGCVLAESLLLFKRKRRLHLEEDKQSINRSPVFRRCLDDHQTPSTALPHQMHLSL